MLYEPISSNLYDIPWHMCYYVDVSTVFCGTPVLLRTVTSIRVGAFPRIGRF